MYWIVRGRSTNQYTGQLWKQVGIKYERDHFISKRAALKYASLLDKAAGKKVFRVVRKAIVTLSNPLIRPYYLSPFFITDYNIETIDNLISKHGYPVTVEDDYILPLTFLNYNRTDFYSEDIYKIKMYFMRYLPTPVIKGLVDNPGKYVVLVINNSRTPYFSA